MLRALLRPSAVTSHVLVLAVVIGCVAAGQWQLDRLATLRAENTRLAERLAEPALRLADVIERSGGVDEAALQYRRVTASGVYRPDEEILQRNRAHAGRSGFHVLTPLELDTGGVVLVRRGWVPSTMDTPPVAPAAPPEGHVTVTGVLELPVGQPGFGPRDPERGTLSRVFHTDTSRLDAQVAGELFAMVLRADGEPTSASPGELPVPPGSPELDERNHLSYAVQWHTFAAIALITYGAWWWTRLRGRRKPSEPSVLAG